MKLIIYMIQIENEISCLEDIFGYDFYDHNLVFSYSNVKIYIFK